MVYSMCLYNSTSFCPFVNPLTFHSSIDPSIHPSSYPSIHPSIYPFIHPFIPIPVLLYPCSITNEANVSDIEVFHVLTLQPRLRDDKFNVISSFLVEN